MQRLLWIIMIGLLGGCAVYVPMSRRSGIPPGHGGVPPGLAKKMAPPALEVRVPSFVLVPGTNISVMVGVEADIFRVNGIYYYFHDSAWYSARHHRGPWKAIAARDLPRGLRGKSPKKLKAKARGRKKRR